MYRKQKPVAPSFGMTSPHDVVRGDDARLYGPYKPFTRFVLEEDLTTADESVKASIAAPASGTCVQWGPGLYHPPKVIVHVHNLLTTAADTYYFSGSSGDIGIAAWDQNNHWRIIQMLTGGALVELCLAENHPGRGEKFNTYMGVWSSATNRWEYPDTSTKYAAIDWRYGTPYPDAGSKGLFTPHPSDVHGIIYDCVSLDCASPGTCDD